MNLYLITYEPLDGTNRTLQSYIDEDTEDSAIEYLRMLRDAKGQSDVAIIKVSLISFERQ